MFPSCVGNDVKQENWNGCFQPQMLFSFQHRDFRLTPIKHFLVERERKPCPSRGSNEKVNDVKTPMKRENIQSGKLIIIYSHTFSGHEKAPTASAKKNKKEITIVT